MNAFADPGQAASAPSFGSAFALRARTAIEHYPYYVSLLRRFPYATYRRIRHKRCAGYSIIEPHVTG